MRGQHSLAGALAVGTALAGLWLVALHGVAWPHQAPLDTSSYRNDWHGVSVATEIVTVDFVEARAARAPAQASLFGEAA